MKKRFLMIVFLLAIIFVPYKQVLAEETNNNLIDNNQVVENSNDELEESSNDDETDESVLLGATRAVPTNNETDVPQIKAAGDDVPVVRATAYSVDVTYDLNGGVAGDNYRETETLRKFNGTAFLSIYPLAQQSFATAADGFVFLGIQIGEDIFYLDDISRNTLAFLSDDTTVTFLWNELITEVDITLTPPVVGEENSMDQTEEGGWDWSTQSNPPVAEVAEDAPYIIELTYWIMGWDGEDYDTPFVGTFEKDTEYHAEFFLAAKEGYQFAENVVVTVNGEDIDEFIGMNNELIDHVFYSGIDVGKLVVPDEYVILEGDNQTHIAYKDGDLTVVSSGNVIRLVEMQVDGSTLDPENYTIESGSTIATLKRDYLDSLDAGTHLLTFVYTNGEVSANFEIVKTNNPQTADIIQVWFLISFVSVMGLGFTALQLRKEN